MNVTDIIPVLFRLFISSVISSDGWESLTLSSELRLLFSLLLCKAALPETNSPQPSTTLEIKVEGIDNDLGLDNGESDDDPSGGKEETAAAAEVPTVTTVNHQNGGSVKKEAHRAASKRCKRDHVGNKRKKLKAVDVNLRCPYCTKVFVRPEGLARHVAGHLFETVDAESATAVRCRFESCDFELVSAPQRSSSSMLSELQEHELTHSCPICRTVYSSEDQIRLVKY